MITAINTHHFLAIISSIIRSRPISLITIIDKIDFSERLNACSIRLSEVLQFISFLFLKLLEWRLVHHAFSQPKAFVLWGRNREAFQT